VVPTPLSTQQEIELLSAREWDADAINHAEGVIDKIKELDAKVRYQ